MKTTMLMAVVLCVFLPMSTVFGVVGGGDLSFTPKNAKPVFFSHEIHVKDKTLKCSACHYHTFQMAKDSYKMEMSKINKGEFCGFCHNGERSFDVKDQKSCGKCHK